MIFIWGLEELFNEDILQDFEINYYKYLIINGLIFSQPRRGAKPAKGRKEAMVNSCSQIK